MRTHTHTHIHTYTYTHTYPVPVEGVGNAVVPGALELGRLAVVGAERGVVVAVQGLVLGWAGWQRHAAGPCGGRRVNQRMQGQ